jgi:hypothetical protein
MTVSTMCSPLTQLTPISLGELNEVAALQTRVDRKYVVRAEDLDGLISRVEPQARVLQIGEIRCFAYDSVYFDTPDRTSYLLAARRRRRRFKVRTRTYVDSSQCWLEVKTRGPRGSTIKNRLPYECSDRATLVPGRWFVDSIFAQESVRGGEEMPLFPSLITRYHRTTLFLPSTTSRATIDTELSWEDPDGRQMRVPGLVIVETKTGSTASGLDRILWSAGHRPTRISKFATGLTALHPELPTRRWRSTLHRHFTNSIFTHSEGPDAGTCKWAGRTAVEKVGEEVGSPA